MTEEEVREKLIVFIKKFSLTKVPIIIGTVSDVNENDYTCTITVDADEDGLKGVRLKLLLDSTTNGIIIIPEDKATAVCLVLDNSENDLLLLHASEIKELRFNTKKLVFNKGQNKGLALLEKLVSRLNKLETDNNTLKQAIAAWAPATDYSGASLKPALASWYGQQLQTTVNGDLENDKIIQ